MLVARQLATEGYELWLTPFHLTITVTQRNNSTAKYFSFRGCSITDPLCSATLYPHIPFSNSPLLYRATLEVDFNAPAKGVHAGTHLRQFAGQLVQAGENFIHLAPPTQGENGERISHLSCIRCESNSHSPWLRQKHGLSKLGVDSKARGRLFTRGTAPKLRGGSRARQLYKHKPQKF